MHACFRLKTAQGKQHRFPPFILFKYGCRIFFLRILHEDAGLSDGHEITRSPECWRAAIKTRHLPVMEFFCVRAKPHYCRRNRSRREDQRSSSIVHIEAQLKRRRRETHNNSDLMARANLCTGSSASSREQHCLCTTCCCSHLSGSPTHNSNRDHESEADISKPSRPGQDDPTQLHPIPQFYVHPYSFHHYRFPVVNYTTTCHGHRLTACPIFYTAIVPEIAAVQDVEAELVNRPGCVGMVRLRATENLVRINTFRCIRTLHEASLQLEVWDIADVAVSG